MARQVHKYNLFLYTLYVDSNWLFNCFENPGKILNIDSDVNSVKYLLKNAMEYYFLTHIK